MDFQKNLFYLKSVSIIYCSQSKNLNNLTRRDVEVAANAEQVFTYDNGGASPEKIQFQKLMKDALELRQSIERREEQQVIEAMTTGKVEVIFDGGKRTINLNIPAANLTAAAAGDKFDAENSHQV